MIYCQTLLPARRLSRRSIQGKEGVADQINNLAMKGLKKNVRVRAYHYDRARNKTTEEERCGQSKIHLLAEPLILLKTL